MTCAQLPDLDEDDRLIAPALAGLGIDAEPVVWDDPDAEWDAYDLVVVRNPWDYTLRRDEFVAWARRVPRLVNPAAVLEWNTDKRYLAELAAAGVPVIHTDFYAPGECPRLGDSGMWVIKPTVSAGSADTDRYDLFSPQRRALAGAHVARLHAAGRTAMAQPYLSAVDTHGETGLLFFNGVFSHAIRKGPMLTGRVSDETGLFVTEEITSREPTAAELEVAGKVLAAAPGDLLYARVDLIPGEDGEPTLLELELTEPSMFLRHGEGAAARFAEAVAARL